MDMGMPKELACDGGKNLTSYEVKTFLDKWGIKLRMSSAHYPQSNGRAECVVKATNKLVHGNTDSHGTLNMDQYLQATLIYRNNTIYLETGKTISQSLMGKNIRDSLPAIKSFYQVKK